VVGKCVKREKRREKENVVRRYIWFRLHLVFDFIPHPWPLSSQFYRANQGVFGWRREIN
jgi:hypothetical protein